MWTSCYTSCMWWEWWLEIWIEFTDFLLVLWKAWKHSNFYSSFQKWGKKHDNFKRRIGVRKVNSPNSRMNPAYTSYQEHRQNNTGTPGLAKVLCHWQDHQRSRSLGNMLLSVWSWIWNTLLEYYIQSHISSQLWWYRPVILTLRK